MITLLLACGNMGSVVIDGPPDEVPEAERDDDEDGFVAEEDCDDEDPLSFPGGDEGTAPDGADNDCDGVVDDYEVGCGGVTDVIMDAVDLVDDGMTILVCPGHYPEDLVLDGRELTILSMEGAGETYIDGSGDTSVVSLTGADITLTGFTISGGLAENGGGVYAMDSELTLSENVIEDNVATQYGGGVYTQSTGADILDNTVEDNDAFEGGGLYVWGQVTLQGNEILENHCVSLQEGEAYHGADGGGGGLFARGKVDILDNVIARNVSEVNGAGVYTLDASGTFSGNLVKANETYEDGSGVYANYTSETYDNNEFIDNFAHDDAGGLRIYVGSAEITNNYFEGNGCNDDGGGLKLSHARSTVSGNTFVDNYAGDSGGALELDNDVSPVSDCVFEDNRAARGAAINAKELFSATTLTDLTFIDNEASSSGGAIYMYDNPYTLTAKRIVVERGDAPFGAAIAASAASVVVRNALITGQDGDAIELTGSTGSFGNIVITDSTGTGIVSDGAYTLYNSILVNNEIGVEGPATVSYSTFWDNDILGDNADGTGVIYEDPDFTASYELESSSPCIDAGTPSVNDPDGSRSDMGYYGGPDAP
ncbi:MAG TPA: putative metal-binding motif-containing protein [Myxococcota bacterium]|nr:putative metal-binding motif-containing protein [Myxococcota bacterium]